jgi:hypothetical protein
MRPGRDQPIRRYLVRTRPLVECITGATPGLITRRVQHQSSSLFGRFEDCVLRVLLMDGLALSPGPALKDRIATRKERPGYTKMHTVRLRVSENIVP